MSVLTRATRRSIKEHGIILSAIISDIYMENFEELALGSAEHIPLLWLWYFDDKFVVCSKGPERLHQ
jgi:hypothetical protein